MALTVRKVARLVEAMVSDGRGDEPIAAFLFTATRVREVLERPEMTDGDCAEILLELQENWGDPPLDDQLVQGVFELDLVDEGP